MGCSYACSLLPINSAIRIQEPIWSLGLTSSFEHTSRLLISISGIFKKNRRVLVLGLLKKVHNQNACL
jgi:hypothetical protein